MLIQPVQSKQSIGRKSGALVAQAKSSGPAGGGNLASGNQGPIAHSLSLSPFYCPDVTEILYKINKNNMDKMGILQVIHRFMEEIPLHDICHMNHLHLDV